MAKILKLTVTGKSSLKQKFNMKNKIKKQAEKLDISSNKLLLCASTSCLSTNETTTSTTIWKGGWVSDNFSTYYLDENMVKHYR